MKRILAPELKMVTTPALLRRGCVVVIGLEAIRGEAGPRWEKMRPSIYSHLESLLRQKLGPSDYYTQLDDLSFLVGAPASSLEEAQVLCVRIAHELHSYRNWSARNPWRRGGRRCRARHGRLCLTWRSAIRDFA